MKMRRRHLQNWLCSGGCALAASRAHDGVTYKKDFDAATLDTFSTMDRFDPDRSWTPAGQR